MALTYIVERAHPNYAHRLPLTTQARLIKGAKGISGANIDYLVSTVRHLRELGIRERELERLVTMIGPLAWQRSRAQHTSPYAAAVVRALRLQRPPGAATCPQGRAPAVSLPVATGALASRRDVDARR